MKKQFPTRNTPKKRRRKLTRNPSTPLRAGQIEAMKEFIRNLKGSLKGGRAYEILMEERRRDLARGK